jgi:hypothetical protein
VPVFPSGLITTTSHEPVLADEGMATLQVIFLLLVTASLVQAIDAEFVFLSSTEAPETKLLPDMLRDFVVPRLPEVGEILVTVGAGAVAMLNAAVFLPDVPSALVTTTSQLPVAAFDGIVNLQVILVELDTATLVATISGCPDICNVTVAPDRKFVPARFVMLTVVPVVPEVGLMLLTVGAGRGFVIVNVFPFDGPPCGSATVMVAVPGLMITFAGISACSCMGDL